MFTIRKPQENGKIAVKFQHALAEGHQVILTDSFNDWAQIAIAFSDGCYRAAVKLVPGNHEYCFIVDGKWISDESNPIFFSNDFDTVNSVLSHD